MQCIRGLPEYPMGKALASYQKVGQLTSCLARRTATVRKVEIIGNSAHLRTTEAVNAG